MRGSTGRGHYRPMTTRGQPLMGTVIGVDVSATDLDTPPRAAATDPFNELPRDIDARFSPWRHDSEISRIGRGELGMDAASDDVRWVLAVCDHLEARTGGAFNARRPGGAHPLDPSGFVKGWAVEEAAERLDAAGLRAYAVNAGGDVLLRGSPALGRDWSIAIRDPRDPRAILVTIQVPHGAVATSGL